MTAPRVSPAHTVVRSRRRTISIAVHRDGAVHVRAPLRAPDALIERVVTEKAGWIAKKQREFAALGPPSAPKQHIAGEEHLYLGQAYPLSISENARETVTLGDDALHIDTPDPHDRERVRILLRRWYRRRAGEVLAERFDAHLPLADRFGVPRPHLVLRDMTRSWGNCRQSGRITLNRDLIRAPIGCVDAVIAHELCHLVHADHSRRFYALLDAVAPDWRPRQQELERLLA